MLVNEYDDERTLDEEEALSGDSCSNELDDLQKEGDMPIDKLLAMYGYNHEASNSSGGEPSNPELHDTRSSSEEEILSNQDLTLDKDVIARDLLKDEDDNKETSVHELLDCVEQSQTVRLLRSASQPGSEDEESDEDYHPERDDDWKKTIQVGSCFQAEVPEGLSMYDDTPAYENEDRLLWDPSKMEDNKVVEKYLQDVHEQSTQNAQGVNAVPTGAHIRDDEQALYLLLQCDHNVEEALRRRKVQAVPPTDPMSLWSEEECRNFEAGLRHYGKDFYHIQQNKVRTRTVGELVQFYYLWKKTERHDIFAHKNRLEKKKYTLHPGITDYMDRFLDEQENSSPLKESSPINSHSLIYGDHKRSHAHSRYEDHTSMTELTGIQPVITSMDPIELNPELKTAVPTTLTTSVSSELQDGQIYMDTLVQTCIANIIPNMPTDVIDSLPDLEPPSKKLKTHSDLSVTTNCCTSELVQLQPTIDSDALAKLEQISNNPMGNVELSISSVAPVSSPSVKETSIGNVSRETSTPTAKESIEAVAQ